MDFDKIKSFAKKATEKTADGISSMNEMRKKAGQETKISFGNTTIRKTIDGLYYIGFYSETPELFEFENFQFEGSTIIERTKTTGTTKQKGKKRECAIRNCSWFSTWTIRSDFRWHSRCFWKT